MKHKNNRAHDDEVFQPYQVIICSHLITHLGTRIAGKNVAIYFKNSAMQFFTVYILYEFINESSLIIITKAPK
jgi:hypothetical protein